MAVNLTGCFACYLGCRIRRDGTGQQVVFAKRDFSIEAVDRTRRAEDETRNLREASGFEQYVCAAHIGLFIIERASQRRSDAGASGKMDDRIEVRASEQIVHGPGVGDIGFDQMEERVMDEGRDVGAFDGGVIKVIEVVEDGEPIATVRE